LVWLICLFAACEADRFFRFDLFWLLYFVCFDCGVVVHVIRRITATQARLGSLGEGIWFWRHCCQARYRNGPSNKYVGVWGNYK
jgi:hypothetical protein